jgi:bacterioferritin (cytochrome b1)
MQEQEAPFGDVVEVLNYALTLEHLEATFYREAVEMFDEAAYLSAGFQASVRDRIVSISENEKDHVDALTAVIEQLEGEPVEEATYDFGYTDLAGFLATAAVVENLGVSAYQGAAQYLIEEDDLLTAALTIHGNEARHAAYLNILTSASPFPTATDSPTTPEDVLAAATPFIVS